jgi:hypothetical protein
MGRTRRTRERDGVTSILRLTFHSDAAHGWLEVPFALLAELGIADKVSAFSYQSEGKTVAFLEEDCDAALFYNAAHEHGYTIDGLRVYDGDESRVRRLPIYGSDVIPEFAFKGKVTA